MKESVSTASMWNGNITFGEGWACYVGVTADQTPHAHAALQIALGLKGTVAIALSGGATISGAALLVAPMVRHRLLSGEAPVLLAYLDAQTELARRLLAALKPATIGELPADVLRALQGDRTRVPAALAELVQPQNTEMHLDARLSQALAALRDDMSVGAVERAAKTVGLSPPRLRALAQTHLHLPLSQWLLWRKLEMASRAVAAGETLAQAATLGGFADQAHLARTMRRMFGITPGEAAAPLRKRSVQEAG